jgi:SnoaL-like domain
MLLPRRRSRPLSAIVLAPLLACLPGAMACSPPPVVPAAAPAPSVDRRAAEQAVARELDDFHDAAARADEGRYFAHFAADGVFLGTDATERWDVAAFRAYAHPRFAAGKAWSFRAARRAVTVSPDGMTAWFDEDLVTERLGPARGSGVLTQQGGTWKIEQYNLATVVPNERFAEVRALLDHPAPPPLERTK